MTIYFALVAAICALPKPGADVLPGALGFLQNQPAVTQSTSAVAKITDKIPAVELIFEELFAPIEANPEDSEIQEVDIEDIADIEEAEIPPAGTSSANPPSAPTPSVGTAELPALTHEVESCKKKLSYS
jgi:hypothetical protein